MAKEVSAKDGTGITELFEEIAKRLLIAKKNEIPKPKMAKKVEEVLEKDKTKTKRRSKNKNTFTISKGEKETKIDHEIKKDP